jgi:hypothetical protein
MMSDHRIEVLSHSRELSLRLVCHAPEGADCKKRPADSSVGEWDGDWENADQGEFVYTDECWAIEYQEDGGWESLFTITDGVWGSIPVSVAYDDGVQIEQEGQKQESPQP